VPALKFAYTDRFGVAHTEARFELTRMHVEMGPDGWGADFASALWHDAQARAAGADPFEERPAQPLTDSEIAILEAQFAIAVYQVLQKRAEFAGATLVP
jgi:hypothetical protein